MSDGAAGGRGSGRARARLRRLLAVAGLYVLLGALPVAALAVTSVRLTTDAVTRQVRSQVQTTAGVSALFVQEQLSSLEEMVQAHASDGELTPLVTHQQDLETSAEIEHQLGVMSHEREHVSSVSLLAMTGWTRSVYPSSGWLRNWGNTDWFRAVSQGHSPIVSGVFTPDIPGGQRAVAVASLMREPNTGRPVGVLMLIYQLNPIEGLTASAAEAQDTSLTIVDQHGIVVAQPGADLYALRSMAHDDRVIAAQAGRSGYHTVGSGDTAAISAYAPVAGTGWAVIAEEPAKVAFARVTRLRSTVTVVCLALGALLLLGYGIQARLLLQRERARRQLARGAAELARARDEALRASALKSDFVANVSHELRTPMNGVLGMTSLLLQSELTPEQREFARTAATSAEALLTMVDGLLDLSKIESGHAELAAVEFDPRAVADDLVDLMAAPAADRGLTLAAVVDGSVPAALVGDPYRLHQVLANLAGNAVKFTAEGEVAIRFGTGPGTLVVTVSDTGIGIRADRLSEIFEPFVQADPSTVRHYGGSGLGLTIARSLARLMGGDIAVESSVGAGTRFTVTLPLHPVDEPATVEAQRGLALVAHPAGLHRESLVCALRWRGVAAATVTGPADAVGRLRSATRPVGWVLVDEDLLTDTGAATELYAAAGAVDAEVVVLHELGAAPTAPADLRRLRLPVAHRDVRALVNGDAAGVPDDEPAEAAHRCGGRVLVVEDNPVNRQVAVLSLAHRGYDVEVATDGGEAVAAVATGRFDAVLMDCRMPGLDGWAATAAIRRLRGPASGVPILAMTASATAADRERCAEVGMDGYIAKPVDWDAADALLRRHLGGSAGPEPVATVPGQPVADVPVVDTAVREAIAALDPALLADVTAELVASVRAAVDDLASPDLAAVAERAHALASAAGTVGAGRLAALLRRIEHLARAGQPVDAQVAEVPPAADEFAEAADELTV